MSDLDLFSKEFGIGADQNPKANNRRTVIWTRVSTIGQEDNTSLRNQRETCLRIAEKDKLEIVQEFGKKGESAKAGALRKEFHRMLAYVKKKSNNIRFILFYDHTRFSREGGKAIFVKEELREKYGVITKSAILPLDTEDPYADLVDSQQLLFARAENEKRRRRTIDGLRAKLESGKWVGAAPFGYYWDKMDGKIKIHPEKGEAVRLAFEWRYNDPNLKVAEIRKKLKARGFDLAKNHAHRIFHNPFYCGLMANNILQGKVVKGNHEPIVSEAVFLAVNNIFKAKSGTVGVYQEERENLPLKVFMKCGCCGRSLTGYEVKNKNGKPRKTPIPYYKCKNKCGVNKNARKLNDLFLDELKNYVLEPNLVPLVSKQLRATLIALNKNQAVDIANLKKKITELENKQKRLRKRFVLDEAITREEYNEFADLLQEEKDEIAQELAKIEKRGSNLLNHVEKLVKIASELDVLWENGSYKAKQGIQTLVFTQGMVYNKNSNQVLTPKVNPIFTFCSQFNGITPPVNEENSGENSPEFHRGTRPMIRTQLLQDYLHILNHKKELLDSLPEIHLQ